MLPVFGDFLLKNDFFLDCPFFCDTIADIQREFNMADALADFLSIESQPIKWRDIAAGTVGALGLFVFIWSFTLLGIACGVA